MNQLEKRKWASQMLETIQEEFPEGCTVRKLADWLGLTDRIVMDLAEVLHGRSEVKLIAGRSVERAISDAVGVERQRCAEIACDGCRAGYHTEIAVSGWRHKFPGMGLPSHFPCNAREIREPQ